MKTVKEYIDSMRDMKFEIYLFGEQVKNHVLWAWSEFNGYAAEVLGSGQNDKCQNPNDKSNPND